MENKRNLTKRNGRKARTVVNNKSGKLTESEQPVVEWLAGNKCLTDQQKMNLLNEVYKAMTEGTATALQHQHRPNEFYISSNAIEASRSLNPVPADLAALKLAALLNRDGNAQMPFNIKINEQLGSNTFLDAINTFELTRVGALILAEVLIGFINAKGSLYLNELGVSIQEYVKTFVLATSGKLPVCNHGLIRFHVETDGVSCRADVTPKALALYAGMSQCGAKAALPLPGSLQLIEPQDIASVNLRLDEHTDAIFKALQNVLQDRSVHQPITTLLHGPSGTGKTEFVLQLAKQAKVPILRLDIPQIRSKWVGETEKIAAEAFDAYADYCKNSDRTAILFLNEADGLLGPRVTIEKGSDLHANQIQNAFLQFLEDFKGVLIATTNYQQNIDSAFKRRFLFWHRLGVPTQRVVEHYLQEQVTQGNLPAELAEAIPLNSLTLAQLKRLEQQYQILKEHCSTIEIAQLVQAEIQQTPRAPIGYRSN